MEIGNEIIKCGNCNGFEYHIVATSEGIVAKCWTCGDKLMLKELYCMTSGHVISSEDAMRLRDSLAKRMAYYFADDNPKFDRGQFLEACGVK